MQRSQDLLDEDMLLLLLLLLLLVACNVFANVDVGW
jgi:hypothetical protein